VWYLFDKTKWNFFPNHEAQKQHTVVPIWHLTNKNTKDFLVVLYLENNKFTSNYKKASSIQIMWKTSIHQIFHLSFKMNNPFSHPHSMTMWRWLAQIMVVEGWQKGFGKELVIVDPILQNVSFVHIFTWGVITLEVMHAQKFKEGITKIDTHDISTHPSCNIIL